MRWPCYLGPIFLVFYFYIDLCYNTTSYWFSIALKLGKNEEYLPKFLGLLKIYKGVMKMRIKG